MGLNIVEKILKEHLVEGSIAPGSEIAVRIDQTLTQDATGTMAFLQFEAMGLQRVRNELALSYVDHNTIQVGFENADDHRYLQSAAARFGVVFSRPGNGVCHQVHLERFAAPGRTLLGSDSHTPTAGGLGMLAIGAGGLDVAVAMGGGPFYLAAPRVIRIWLTGRLPRWVTAKDIALNTLRRFGTQGNVGCVFEYAGPGLAYLDVPERATIANMGAECGVTTTVFPSDALTLRFLEAQGRPEVWREIKPDPDAVYSETFRVNLSELEPLAAAPHSPGNIVTVASLNEIEVDQVLIGSCTNSSYRDLATVARLLEGRKAHERVSLGIAPGSRQVMAMLAHEKKLQTLIAAGARLLENACGFCIGNSMSPGTNAVSLRTSNRNFEGRSGTASAQVYLVSPVVAAVAAVEGRVLDPRKLDWVFPKIKQPSNFLIDDSMFIYPPADGAAVEIARGPNIGAPPVSREMPESPRCVMAIKVGDRITTDHIMPAGARLKFRSNIPAYSKYVFENVDPSFAERAAKNRDAGLENIILAGESYGQGSSREHAAICPMFLGVRAVIAKSIERIHAANLINFGILPLCFANPSDYEFLQQGDVVTFPDIREAIRCGSRMALRHESSGKDILLISSFSERQRSILLAGGLLRHITNSAKA